MSGHDHVAVADYYNCRVSVFSVEGEFVRHVGVGELIAPSGVACSVFDDIVVADDRYDGGVLVFSASGDRLHTMRGNRVVVFCARGEMLLTMGGVFTGVAIHGGTIFAQTYSDDYCVVLT